MLKGWGGRWLEADVLHGTDRADFTDSKYLPTFRFWCLRQELRRF